MYSTYVRRRRRHQRVVTRRVGGIHMHKVRHAYGCVYAMLVSIGTHEKGWHPCEPPILLVSAMQHGMRRSRRTVLNRLETVKTVGCQSCLFYDILTLLRLHACMRPPLIQRIFVGFL